jgi:hypothetical protein
MARISSKTASPNVPLEEDDWKLLAELFEKLNSDDLQQIEQVSTSLIAVRLETWEESNWSIGTMVDAIS